MVDWLSRVLALLQTYNGAVTALATGLIAIFTSVSVWQAKLTRDSIRLARKEFFATHRPKIKIHVAEFKHFPPKENQNVNRAGASMLCFNVGESDARNVEIRGQIFAGSNFAVDVMRPLVKRVPKLESGIKLRVDIDSDFPATEVASGPRQGRDFYLIGWIAYWDDNGLRRETGFCFRAKFSPAGDRWVSAGKPEYEYAY